jgi:hypothetical protein
VTEPTGSTSRRDAAGPAVPAPAAPGATGPAASARPAEAAEAARSSPERGLRLLRLRLAGVAKGYEIDLRGPDGRHRPLSVIAGPTNTGKTSILRFLDYCLGASNYPDNPETVRQVRSAVAYTVGPDGPLTLERGINSNKVMVLAPPVDRGDSDEDYADADARAIARPVDPPGDPSSVSQLLLSTVGLQDVRLKEAPTQAASGTDPLSFRDLMWLCLFLNERVGSVQLLHENDFMKRLKLVQVVDAVFGVHDLDGAELARRLRDARAALDAARRDVVRLTEFVAQQQPRPRAALEDDVAAAGRDIRDADEALAALDGREAAATGFAADLRARHGRAAAAAARARARLRDRQSQVDRFASLRAQYADDVRKLTLLSEAAAVFDQLSVRVCPACMTDLPSPLEVVEGRCGLCSHELPAAASTGRPADADDSGADLQGVATAGQDLVRAELRATKRRYSELNDYWSRLDAGLSALADASEAADAAETAAAAAVDRAIGGALTPYAAEREAVLVRRQAALVLRDRALSGVRLWKGVERREAEAAKLAQHVERLRAQAAARPDRADRAAVLNRLSARYAAILREIGYPKIDQQGESGPFLDDRLVPHARGRSYREASSGGRVLLTLAWMLAVFEVAHEDGAAHPGFLLIDTPQKNLGGQAQDDDEFSDAALIDRFYEHILRWLGGPGTGAQIVIVDNTPPAVADPHVVVRYTRDPARPPFGLIDNETG